MTKSSDWINHTPRFSGDAPPGLKADVPVPGGYEVEFLSRVGRDWRRGKKLGYLPSYKYRYRRTGCDKTMCHAPGCGDCYPAKSATGGSLPDDAQARLQYPMADGLLDYFPNALAEVSKLSFVATQQHHPDQPMHWDRSKSTDHRNKIMRHLVDTGKLDDKGMRHSAMVAWRALALLQEELERDQGLPPSRASRSRPDNF